VREDLHGLSKVVTKSGSVRFAAERTADGHSDRGTALALALHAATDAGRQEIYFG
jgi:phage FluMu gp28-like protein